MTPRVVYELKIVHRASGTVIVDSLYLYWSDARSVMKQILEDWQASDLQGGITERTLF